MLEDVSCGKSGTGPANFIALIMLCGQMSVPSAILTPARTYLPKLSMAMPRRANTHAAWATGVPVSANMRISSAG
jgi:hypothetical protein